MFTYRRTEDLYIEIEKKTRCSPLYANIIMDSIINASMGAGLKLEKNYHLSEGIFFSLYTM